MITVNPICPISTRTAYFGARRIAPVAATSRFEAWGARPAVEELRPARSHFKADEAAPARFELPTAAFVTQALGQFPSRQSPDPHTATRRYLAADELGGEDPRLVVATI